MCIGIIHTNRNDLSNLIPFHMIVCPNLDSSRTRFQLTNPRHSQTAGFWIYDDTISFIKAVVTCLKHVFVADFLPVLHQPRALDRNHFEMLLENPVFNSTPKPLGSSYKRKLFLRKSCNHNRIH